MGLMADGAVREDVMRVDVKDGVATLALGHPERRNAINDRLISGLDAFFTKPPEDVNAVIPRGDGGDFRSRPELTEHEKRDPIDGVHRSRNWHRVSDLIEFGDLPIISVLTGVLSAVGWKSSRRPMCALPNPTRGSSCLKAAGAFSWVAARPFGRVGSWVRTGCGK